MSKPRNTNRELMGMDNGGRVDYGNGGYGARLSNGEKDGTIVTKQQFRK